MKWLIITNAFVTFILGMLVAWLVSNGHFLTTAHKHPLDFIFIALGAGLAFLASNFSINDMQRGSWKKSALIYTIYYYGVLGLFADGHAAGWSHSDGFIDKLVMAMIYIFVSIFSVFIPLVLGTISAMHASLLWMIVGRKYTKKCFK